MSLRTGQQTKWRPQVGTVWTVVCSVVPTSWLSCPRAARCTVLAQQCALSQGRPGWRAHPLGHFSTGSVSWSTPCACCAFEEQKLGKGQNQTTEGREWQKWSLLSTKKLFLKLYPFLSPLVWFCDSHMQSSCFHRNVCLRRQCLFLQICCVIKICYIKNVLTEL